eukprot:c26776_g1_i1 orf=144-335(+)
MALHRSTHLRSHSQQDEASKEAQAWRILSAMLRFPPQFSLEVTPLVAPSHKCSRLLQQLTLQS